MVSIVEERALSKLEENLKVVYEKIGKKYYEENKNDLKDISYQQYFEEIKKVNEERNKLEVQKLALQGKKRCSNCQAIVSLESKFCNMCGEKMVEIVMPEKKQETNPVRRCAECGTELEEDAMFCPNCGRKY